MSIFLNHEIDSGPIIVRKKFPAPNNRTKIDHLHDNALRSKVLIETLNKLNYNDEYKFVETSESGETYFVIHPVLKHIAILSKK